jgi:hypothetical protein
MLLDASVLRGVNEPDKRNYQQRFSKLHLWSTPGIRMRWICLKSIVKSLADMIDKYPELTEKEK